MWFGFVPQNSGKSSLSNAFLSFPTAKDKVCCCAIFGKSVLPDVNDAHPFAANTDFLINGKGNSYRINKKKMTFELLTSPSDILNDLGAEEVKTSSEVKILLKSHFFLTKGDGGAIQDGCFVPQVEGGTWYKFLDALKQPFLVNLKEDPDHLVIQQAFFPLTVGFNKWCIEGVAAVMTEGISFMPTSYLAADRIEVTQSEDVSKMQLLNDLSSSEGARYPAPYTFCFKLNQDKPEHAKIINDTLKALGATEEFYQRRQRIYKRWHDFMTASTKTKTSYDTFEGLNLDGTTVLSFCKPPIALQLDAIGMLTVDSIVGYIYAYGKSYLKNSLNSDIIQVGNATLYSFVFVWYPPFKDDATDPLRSVGRIEAVASGSVKTALNSSTKKLKPEIVVTHRLLNGRGSAFRLVSAKSNSTGTLKFATFWPCFDAETHRFKLRYLFGSADEEWYKAKQMPRMLSYKSIEDCAISTRNKISMATLSGDTEDVISVEVL